jgi:hypothetical protein
MKTIDYQVLLITYLIKIKTKLLSQFIHEI